MLPSLTAKRQFRDPQLDALLGACACPAYLPIQGACLHWYEVHHDDDGRASTSPP
ncbi:hypothetical protein VFPFJ_05126 [Purpureocillium lilacinum]|uniref:Uncharacterized protein n=1 Tax=Purpureocillium lilacinum TaxID=33203 RepID=A0A179H1P5_PURLI|nr:hypothetical protein VFPFJ_05126 [Purpureocillium lilacinum]OAQ84176.1 hypothetical protein VFPBJ_02944 [Purpureocillium lilacinum]OAQ90967.1 hypothetical protein VFPFJ_05126 [Purpureocillium lilacinum]